VPDTAIEIALNFTLVYQDSHVIKLWTVNYFSLVKSHWLEPANVQLDFYWAEEEIWSYFGIEENGERCTTGNITIYILCLGCTFNLTNCKRYPTNGETRNTEMLFEYLGVDGRTVLAWITDKVDQNCFELAKGTAQ
jgi:hypothetical protein